MDTGNNRKLNYLANIEDYIEDYKVVNIQLSKDERVLVLCISEIPERINGMFVQSRTDKSYSYRIIEVSCNDASNISYTDLHDQQFNYHFVQTIDESKYLLVGARCRYYSEAFQDKNAKIFDRSGNLINEFVLGDGIQDVIVTNENVIWTSYFDEGVIGNYGWDNPIGAGGILSWDNEGNQKFSFLDEEDGFSFFDCYAMNFDKNNNFWFYYYKGFALVKIDPDEYYTYFNPDVSGADGFLIGDNHILFRGGYNNRDDYLLFECTGTDLKLIDIFKLSIEDTEVKSYDFACRDSYMVHLIDNKIYDFRLE